QPGPRHRRRSHRRQAQPKWTGLSNDASVNLLAGTAYVIALHYAGQTFERNIERLIAFGEAESNHGVDRVGRVEGRDRYGCHLVLDYEPLAEAFVIFVEHQRLKVDIEKIRALRVQHRQA